MIERRTPIRSSTACALSPGALAAAVAPTSVPPALTDPLRGTVQYIFSDVGTVQPHIKAGHVKPSPRSRASARPTCPSCRPCMSRASPSTSMAKTPLPVAERLNAIMREEYSRSGMQQRLQDIDVILKLGTLEDLAVFQRTRSTSGCAGPARPAASRSRS